MVFTPKVVTIRCHRDKMWKIEMCSLFAIRETDKKEVMVMMDLNDLIYWPTVGVLVSIIVILIILAIWLIKRNRRI